MRARSDRIGADPIEDLLAVTNTEHGPEAVFPIVPGATLEQHYDHLRSAENAVRFLRRRARVPPGAPTPKQLALLAQIRAATQALARGERTEFRRRLAGLSAQFRYRLGPQGYAPEATGWSAFAAALLPTLVHVSERRDRLRVCANPGCGWVFFDRSRRGHKVWCETAACGNRAKMRRYRTRSRVS